MTSLDFLRRITLFKDLPQEELESIQPLFQEREYKKNQVIFMEEETGKYMYIVKFGEVKVVQSSSEGRENILAIHHSGDTFGEMSLMDNMTAPATVVAMEDCKIITISKMNFDNVLMRNPHVVQSMLASLCFKLRDAWKIIQVLKFTDAETRLKHILLNLANTEGIQQGDEICINVKVTHQELAEMAGTSRETISRLMSKMQSHGLLKISAHKFVLIGHPFWKESKP
jgi:CRP/FNR family cyclic AMP-dependent transcriptional regulator